MPGIHGTPECSASDAAALWHAPERLPHGLCRYPPGAPRIHQHDHTVMRNVDTAHTDYGLGPVVILFFLKPYLAFLRGNDHILMMGHDGLLAVQSRYDNDAAFSVEKILYHWQ